MGGDVANRHPAGVHPEDSVIQPRQTGLALGHQLGLKRALPIPRGVDIHRPELGLYRLRGGAVAHVPDPARRRLTRRIAQMLGQLALERRVDHPTRELREQPALAGDLVRVKTLQRVLQCLLGKQLPQAITRRLRKLPRIDRGTRRTATTTRRGLLTHLLHDERGPFSAAPRVGIAAPPYGLRVEPDPATRAESVTRTSHRSSDRTRLACCLAAASRSRPCS